MGYVIVGLLAVVLSLGGIVIANSDDPKASAVAATDDQTTATTEPASQPDPEPEPTKKPDDGMDQLSALDALSDKYEAAAEKHDTAYRAEHND